MHDDALDAFFANDRPTRDRIAALRRRAWRLDGIVLIRVDEERNPVLKRLAEDRGFAEFGPRAALSRSATSQGVLGAAAAGKATAR